MRIVRWDPFRELSTLHERLSRLVSDEDRLLERDFNRAPAVDVFEKGDDLVIRAELPGVKTADIDIRVENGNLVLHGERKRDVEVENAKAYKLERFHGTFTRSFVLPTTVEASKINATFADGVLEIALPKADRAKARKVDVKAA